MRRFLKAAEPVLQPVFYRVRKAEEHLGPDDDWFEDDRRVLYENADRFLRPLGRPTVRDKTGEPIYATVSAGHDEVERWLHPTYHRNSLSTRKYRQTSCGRQWAVGSWVHDPDDTEWQHHVYLFPSEAGGTDIYAHTEPSVMEPAEHHAGPAEHGDKYNILQPIIEEHI